jgi:hypothetical protein
VPDRSQLDTQAEDDVPLLIIPGRVVRRYSE